MSFKFIHCSDLHCGLSSYCKSYEDRLVDWEKAFMNMISYTEHNKIDYVFLVGDLFHKNVPDIETLVVANNMLLKLSKICKKVILIAGNHDINSISKKRHILQSITLDNLILLDQTAFYELDDCPFNILHYHYLDIKNVEVKDPTKPHIVTFHGNVTGAIDDLGNSTGEGHISKEQLISSNPIYVAMGHIHKRQNMENDKNIAIVYPGSFIQTTFTEEKQDKGFLDVSYDALNEKKIKANFVKNPYLEYKSIFKIEDLNPLNIFNKIIRINFNMSLVDKENYKEILKSAYFVTFNHVELKKEVVSHNENEQLEDVIKHNMSDIQVDNFDINFLIETRLSILEQEYLKEIMSNVK